MRNPFGRWATWSAIPFSWTARRNGDRPSCRFRRAVAHGAGVGRTPVLLNARGAERDRVRDVVPMNAHRAR